MSTLRIPRLGVKCLPVFRRPFVSTACSRALLRACSSIRSTEGLPCAVSSSQFLCSPSCLWFPTLQPNRPITVPNLIRYSGTVLQPRSVAVSSPIVGVTFAIYKQQEGGAPVWLETQNVTPDATGHYSVLLGSTTATGLPSDLFSLQEERWLGVQVQGQPEQSRVLLVSVPYAMKAAEADRLAGHSASEFVTTDNLQTAVQQQLQQQTPKGATSVIATGTTTNNGVTPIVTNPATNFVDNTTNQVVQVQQNGTGMGLTVSAPGTVAILGTLNSSRSLMCWRPWREPRPSTT